MDAEPHDRSTLPYRDPVGLADLAGFGPAAVPAGVPGKRTLAVASPAGDHAVFDAKLRRAQTTGEAARDRYLPTLVEAIANRDYEGAASAAARLQGALDTATELHGYLVRAAGARADRGEGVATELETLRVTLDIARAAAAPFLALAPRAPAARSRRSPLDGIFPMMRSDDDSAANADDSADRNAGEADAWRASLQDHSVARAPAPAPSTSATATVQAGVAATAASAPSHAGVPAALVYAPDSVNLGDVLPGTRAMHNVVLFSTEPKDRSLRDVRLEHGRANSPLFISSTPDRVYGSHWPVQAQLSNPIALTFAPLHPGEHGTALRFTVGDRSGPHQDVRIPVAARARGVGMATTEERMACESADSAEAAEARAAEDRQERIDTLRADNERRDDPYPQAKRDAIRTAFALAKNNADLIADLHADGVMSARDEAASYRREPPRVAASLVAEIAEVALSMALAGVAGALATRIARELSIVSPGGLRTLPNGTKVEVPTEHPSSKEFTTLVTDVVKDGFKRSGKWAIGELRGSVEQEFARPSHPQRHAEPYLSSNARIAYFDGQLDVLRRLKHRQANLLVTLEDDAAAVLRVDPAAAVAGARASSAALEAEALSDNPRRQQKLHTVVGWMQAVARDTLGETTSTTADACDAPGTTARVTDLETAAVAPTERRRPKSLDGVLDVAFDADLTRADLPVKVVDARLTGVAQEHADFLIHGDLLRLPLPVRAYGQPARKRNAAVLPVTITRDEAGAVRVAGDLDFLARKVPPHVGSDDDALDAALAVEGGRLVIEREILGTQLQGIQVKTDDATSSRG